MTTTRLSSKGQVVLPRGIRESHRWKPGTRFAVEETGDCVVLRPLKPRGVTRLEDVVGCAGYTGPAKTVRQMDLAVAREAKRRGKL